MKKQLKTYSIMGHISCSMVFRMGQLKIRANFEGGSLTSQGIVPAEYKTSDMLVQHIIESSDKYKKGLVTLSSAIDLEQDEENDIDQTPDSVLGDITGGSTANPSVTEYPSVTNFQAAKSIMMSAHEVPLAELQTKDELIAKAASMNISFPNWK